MPPRISTRRLPGSVAIKQAPLLFAPRTAPFHHRLAFRRYQSVDGKPSTDSPQKSPGPNQEQLPHVSEEAAATSKIQGDEGPDLSQGTPVQEVLNRDPSGTEKAPKVMQKSTQALGSKSSSRSFSTSARKLQLVQVLADGQKLPRPGHTFELPDLPLPEHSHLKSKYRTEEIVYQVTRLIMRDGKLAKAERDMALILNHLRTAPVPAYDPRRPLLPDAPPPAHLPLDPILYLTLAIDSIAPLLRIRSEKGAAGGGVSLQLPVPLAVKQRRRRAVTWILDAVEKKPSRGSGKGQFAQKVAEELVAIVEGRSAVWEKRAAVHRLGMASRSNLSKVRRR